LAQFLREQARQHCGKARTCEVLPGMRPFGGESSPSFVATDSCGPPFLLRRRPSRT
jgi:hypothetical protein